MSIVDAHRAARRVRVQRGIYQQPNGKYAVCFMVDGKPRFRAVGYDLEEARAARSALEDAGRRGEVPIAPNLRVGTVADRWIARYETLVAADLRRLRTLEAHRYYLDKRLRRTATTSTVISCHGWVHAGSRRSRSRTSAI